MPRQGDDRISSKRLADHLGLTSWLIRKDFSYFGDLGNRGVGYVTPIAVLVRWFPDKRGFITGLAVMGFGFGAAIMGQIAPFLIPKTASSSSGHVCRVHLYEPFRCRIESVADLTPAEKLFRLTRLDGEPFGHKPGQFMMVSVGGIGEAPISVSSSPSRGAHLELGVRKTGVLTAALHALQSGAELGLRGPFGTFFDGKAMQGKDLLLISGGCGLAPMRALIQYLEDHRSDYGRVTILYGAKSPQDMLYKGEIKMWQQSRMA